MINNKIQFSKNMTNKEFVIMIIIGVAIWWVPKWIFHIQGIIISGLLPVIGFAIGYGIVIILRKFRKRIR